MEKDIIEKVNKMIEESDVRCMNQYPGTVFVRVELPNGIVLYDLVDSQNTTTDVMFLKNACIAQIKNRIIEYERYYEAQLKYEHGNKKKTTKIIQKKKRIKRIF